MAKPGALERIRLEEAQGTNERLERIEAMLAQLLDALVPAEKTEDDDDKPANKKTAGK